MKIELRKIRHAPGLSQETNAYSAEVWVDGVKRGTSRNDGHGGPELVEPASLAVQISEYARTLPPVKVPWGSGELAMTGDLLIAKMVQRDAVGRRLARMLKTKVVLVKGGKAYTVKADPSKFQAKAGEVVLNGLPFEDAVTLFMEAP